MNVRGNTHDVMWLIGAHYRRGGETPRDGFDCFTLMRYVRRVYFERETPTGGGIPAEALPSSKAAALAIYRTLGGRERIGSQWVEVLPLDGCAVALGQWRISRLHHCGVFVGDGVLHALESCGVVFTPINRLADLYRRIEYFECVPRS